MQSTMARVGSSVVEQKPFKLLAVGSSPTQPTTSLDDFITPSPVGRGTSFISSSLLFVRMEVFGFIDGIFRYTQNSYSSSATPCSRSSGFFLMGRNGARTQIVPRSGTGFVDLHRGIEDANPSTEPRYAG